MHGPKLQRFRLIFSCILLGTIVGLGYLVPQLLAWKNNFTYAYFMKADEPGYAAQLVRVIQGYWHIGDPWTLEHRNSPNIIPPMPERVLSVFHHAFDMSANDIIILARGLLPALGSILLFLTLIFLGLTPAWGLATSAAIYLLPDVYYYKPFVSLISPMNEHPFNRFSNPLFGQAVFYLGLLTGARAFLIKEKYALYSIMAGVILGSLFYVSIYYWTHLGLAFLLCAFLIGTEHRWKVLLIGIGTTALVALPYAQNSQTLLNDPTFRFIGWRNGLFLKEQGWYLLEHKALFLMLTVSLPFIISKDIARRYLAVSILAGALCYFSTLLTGISLQNFHWHYTLAPLAAAGFFWVLSDLIRRISPVFSLAWMAILITACYANLKIGFQEFSTTRESAEPGIGLQDRRYQRAYQWLSENANHDSVVIANVNTLWSVPARSGLRSWITNGVQLVSFEEILERYQTLWALEGLTGDQVGEKITPKSPPPVAAWTLGLNRTQVRELEALGLPILGFELQKSLAADVAKLQDRLKKIDVLSASTKYRADYLLLGPNEKLINQNYRSFLKTELLQTLDGVEVHRIISWRSS